MTFPNTIISNTPAPYEFYIKTGGNTTKCDTEPLEWASCTLEFKRDLKLGGVFGSLIVETLTFVGNGAKILRDVFTANELNSEAELIIKWWKGSTRSYVEFPNRYNIDFNFYRIVKIGKFAFGVQVKAINSSMQSKLEARKDIEVDLSKLVSMGEVSIVDFPDLKKNLTFDAVSVQVYGRWFRGDRFQLDRKSGFTTYTSIPLYIMTNDYSEARDVGYITQVTTLASIPAFFKTALYDYTFSFYYFFQVEVTNGHSGDPWTIKVIECDDAETIYATTTIEQFGATEETLLITDTIELTVSAGHNLKLVVEIANLTGIGANIRNSEITLNQAIASTEAKTTEGLPILEAFTRVSQLILDEQYPFYSPKFGRTGVVYDSSGNAYSSSDQLTYAHIQSGLNQRGVSIDDPDNPISCSFNKLFDGANAIWNLGYGFETVSNSLKLVVKDYADFFQNTEVLDLSSRIDKYDIVSEVMPELVPIEIRSGFENFEYLEVNGRAEPNTTNQRTTIVNTTAKYDIVSPLMGDTKSIISNLSNPIDTTGTEDIKGDNKIFIVKTQADGDGWKVEKDENIQIVANSIFGEDLMNRYFTPTRMLIRHGNRTKSGLTKCPTSYLRFQKSEKLQTLETVGEGYQIKENDNILISTLDDPIYKPMAHTVEVDFDNADLETLQANPYGYITFSDTISGYLLTLKMERKKRKATISIIEKYVS